MSDLLFYIAALITIAGGVAVVALDDVRRASAALAVMLLATAGLFAMGGSFIGAGVQVMAAAAGLLLSRRSRVFAALGEERDGTERSFLRFAALPLSVAVAAVLLVIVWTVPAWRDASLNAGTSPGAPSFVDAAGALVTDSGLLLLLLAPVALVVAFAAVRAYRDEERA